MLANRRYLGVSFAVSHATHLLAIFALGGWSLAGVVARAGVPAAALGGIAYAFLAAMTATSFDRTRRGSAPGAGAVSTRPAHTTSGPSSS